MEPTNSDDEPIEEREDEEEGSEPSLWRDQVERDETGAVTLRFVEDNEADQLLVEVAWFYRFYDLNKHAELKEVASKGLVRRVARLKGAKKGVSDKGRYKELCFSDHVQHVPAYTMMHPVRVWCLPDESLAPVIAPQQPAAAAAGNPAAPAAAGRGGGSGRSSRGSSPSIPEPVLLPGFVCRRVVITKKLPTKVIWMRDAVGPSRKKEVKEDMAALAKELLQRSEVERKEFKATWERRVGQKRKAAAGTATG
ncbi:hypothetical protein GPECTOR_14g101 [Gonium pectorale]|uniref:BAH domain-containing protein n=1 Tax=Gonium pectorale TaxID=33097 RepID=A0A150GLW5_GONPE|nr:hypothetical protein GPECTOR_14g101 [Gonium pectorale]|eukprot:KXZ50849.1 hypothetical protein GPECTOR_14g101 [Gonium pectorale]